MENKSVDSFFDEKFKEIKAKEIEDAKKRKNEKQNKKQKKKKRRVVRVLALLLIPIIGIGSYIAHKLTNKKSTPEDVVVPPAIITLDDLGMEEEIVETTENKELGETTGDIDKDKLVEKDGTIYKDKEAADKSDDIGKVVIDTKDDTLVVKPNGEVFEKEEEHIIIKEDGTKEELTEEELKDKYVYDENLDELVAKEDVNKFVKVDADYYDKFTGELVYSKGQEVLKETLEKIKKDENLTTTKPTRVNSTTTTTTAVATTTTQSGKYIDSTGNVWASFQDYEKGIENISGIYVDELGVY